ncbi:MAG: AAA family ATPase [Thermoanaerobaculaceae bacterium]|nr:AAA family ATPase [Thermoanaerobaculaceae bacterium]
MTRELEPRELHWHCPAEWLPAASTQGIEPSQGIIGQARAMEALEFGLEIQSLGFNVFVTGLTGTGKMTAVELHLRPRAVGPVPDDLVYVYNFSRPEQPVLLRLHSGKGAALRDGLDRVLRQLAEGLPSLFQGDEFQRRAELSIEDLKQRQQELIRSFERRVKEGGFTLVQVQVGSLTRPEILPVIEDRPVPLERLQALAEDGKLGKDKLEELEARHGKLAEELGRVFHEVTGLQQEMARRVEEVRRTMVEPIVTGALAGVRAAVEDARVDAYLQAVKEDLLEHLELFAQPAGENEDPLLRYRVNVVVDNGATQGRPVIIETEPTLTNLFGTVEARLAKDWQSTSDHTRIRAGSLLRASGGFLVLNAFDTLAEPGVWPALKRALRYRRVVIRPREMLFAITGQAIAPEPADIDVKVVMVGDRALYDLLHELDEDFRKIFKVLADFDSVMKNGQEQVRDFLSVMAKIVREEHLPPVDRGGMAALVEEAVRLAGGRRHISARFSDVADILREAAFLARQRSRRSVGAAEIRAARLARRGRHSLPEEKLTELMTEGVLNIATEGWAVGQVNGLAVYDLGYHAFGLPGRVTAQVALGREGVVNIEREAGLSGRTHDKGVLILAGFLRGTFAKEMPLSMSASVAFEQSYTDIDGDSASSTEVYAILSALSGLPIRQDVAVTGSVDQQGLVQAIGGVNEKIEGFFELCRRRGLSGSQGVVIPAANVADLQLDPEVVAAVEKGAFHVWTVASVAEGIELLTGVPAGERGPDGRYPADSVFGRCSARLAEMAEQLRRFREV